MNKNALFIFTWSKSGMKVWSFTYMLSHSMTEIEAHFPFAASRKWPHVE